jgi:hypothetical protein
MTDREIEEHEMPGTVLCHKVRMQPNGFVVLMAVISVDHLLPDDPCKFEIYRCYDQDGWPDFLDKYPVGAKVMVCFD